LAPITIEATPNAINTIAATIPATSNTLRVRIISHSL
jgi:hypothetical protein